MEQDVLKMEYEGTKTVQSIWRVEAFPVWGTFLLLLSATLLSGCLVTFTNSLPKSLATRQDQRLFGRWVLTDEENNQVILTFEAAGTSEARLTFRGGSRDFSFQVVTTKIGERDYMILTFAGGEKDKERLIAKYSVEERQLTLCLLDVEKTRAAIASGVLKGESGGGPESGPTITASPNEILTFLKSRASDGLFSCKQAKKAE